MPSETHWWISLHQFNWREAERWKKKPSTSLQIENMTSVSPVSGTWICWKCASQQQSDSISEDGTTDAVRQAPFCLHVFTLTWAVGARPWARPVSTVVWWWGAPATAERQKISYICSHITVKYRLCTHRLLLTYTYSRTRRISRSGRSRHGHSRRGHSTSLYLSCCYRHHHRRPRRHCCWNIKDCDFQIFKPLKKNNTMSKWEKWLFYMIVFWKRKYK